MSVAFQVPQGSGMLQAFKNKWNYVLSVMESDRVSFCLSSVMRPVPM